MALTLVFLIYATVKAFLFATGIITAISISYVIYNLYFHPLRHYPGPLIHRATVLGHCRELLGGTIPYTVRDLHQKYGPVVRIAPNELAFSDPEAWKDIHMRNKALGKYEFPQDDDWYNATGAKVMGIIELPREEHDRVRKLLADGFSERAIRAQEPVITQYVDLLIARLRERCNTKGDGKPKKATDMRNFMAFTTFDIIGKLAFGTDFGCLDGSDFHPLIGMALASLKALALMHVLKIWNVLVPMMWTTKKLGLENPARLQFFNFVGAMTKQRIEMGTDEKDFMDGLIESGMPFKFIKKNATLLLLAGSETSATTLAGTIYFLTTHPDVFERLKREVRGRFKSEDEITIASVSNLTYMLAVLNETMRLYPPVAVGNPRRVPEGGAIVAGRHIPAGTVVALWHMAVYHSPEHFHDPLKFDPDRFLKSTGVYANDKLSAINPFIIGPRNCIGQTLAYAEMRLILAKLIWNFDMTIDDACVGWNKQKNFLLWEKPALNVYLEEGERPIPVAAI